MNVLLALCMYVCILLECLVLREVKESTGFSKTGVTDNVSPYVGAEN